MTDGGSDGEPSGHMSGRMTTRIDVIGRMSGRRRWAVEQKLAILRDAFGPAGSVRAACERHELGSGQLYIWRRQAMSGQLTGIRPAPLPAFAEVEVDRTPPLLPPCAEGSGRIEIELPSGVRLTVDAAVDADAWRG